MRQCSPATRNGMPDAPSRMRPRRVLAAAASGLVDFVAHQGGNADALLRTQALDGALLTDPRQALDLGDYCALMEGAARETRNENFGLFFGHQFQPEQLGPIGELALASPNIGSALENLARYFPYHQQVTQTRLITQGDRLQLEYRIIDGRILERRQDAELTMGMFLNILRRAFGAQWSPDSVLFEHPRPPDARAHQERFHADVHFGQRINAISFRSRDLSRAMPGQDLAAMQRLREELQGLDGGTGQLPLVEQVKGELRSRLCEGEPGIATVAEALGLPRWTLQRRLAEQGLNFATLLAEMRKSLALAYLREPHLSVLDVSTLLGYSETSAFTRAFTQWFGLSPIALRGVGQGARRVAGPPVL